MRVRHPGGRQLPEAHPPAPDPVWLGLGRAPRAVDGEGASPAVGAGCSQASSSTPSPRSSKAWSSGG